MGISETLAKLRELAADVPHDDPEALDDMYEAEFLLASCDTPLSAAAFQHSMAMFLRLRSRAVAASYNSNPQEV